MIHWPIKDREAAGVALARALADLEGQPDVTVLALPRGGVPLAAVIARSLAAPLDLMLVRKLGLPGQEELAMGAIAPGDIRVLNPDVVSVLQDASGVIARVERREREELQRRQQRYRGNRPLPALEGRRVVLVDDGAATGASMRVAIAALRAADPAEIIVAVPVAPADVVGRLQDEADRVVCLATPEPFLGVGCWYQRFPQISDEDVCALLAAAWDADGATG